MLQQPSPRRAFLSHCVTWHLYVYSDGSTPPQGPPYLSRVFPAEHFSLDGPTESNRCDSECLTYYSPKTSSFSEPSSLSVVPATYIALAWKLDKFILINAPVTDSFSSPHIKAVTEDYQLSPHNVSLLYCYSSIQLYVLSLQFRFTI